ncbi:MAG: formate dehydrogenase subunit gamma [Lautropia sp.]
MVDTLVDAHRQQPGALLPLLHAVQDAIGFIPPSAVPAIAAGLGLSRAEVHGVVTYYHHFRQQPPARHLVQVCRAEACQARGADALLLEAQRLLGCAADGRRADGEIGIESVYCLGLCAMSPAVRIDGRAHARMDAAKLARLARAIGVDG